MHLLDSMSCCGCWLFCGWGSVSRRCCGTFVGLICFSCDGSGLCLFYYGVGTFFGGAIFGGSDGGVGSGLFVSRYLRVLSFVKTSWDGTCGPLTVFIGLRFFCRVMMFAFRRCSACS